MGSLGALRVRKHPPAPAFGLMEPDFHSVNIGGATFEGSLKKFLKIWMKWGSNLSLFFFQEQLRKLFFLKIEIFTICLLLPLFLDDPVC